ncbi:unnamed protein product [Arabis nemorensis]|uniref:Uncharacterized protein n=1 Tax=Arabis nemorensis TaxID=586526 RepID=A0A565BSB7_9BRAS|nr:unnamed protein product [Arabis nemorensis]
MSLCKSCLGSVPARQLLSHKNTLFEQSHGSSSLGLCGAYGRVGTKFIFKEKQITIMEVVAEKKQTSIMIREHI